MEFRLNAFHRDLGDEELLADLRQTADLLSTQGRTLSFRSYDEAGRFAASTFAERFGSWNDSL